MKVDEVMTQLKKMGSPGIKKIFLNHGAAEPLFGVRIGDLKTIQKKIRKDHQLAMELYSTGNYDAMFLAGLIADESKMSKKNIQDWASKASSNGISQYTVAWVAAESDYGWELGMEWIESKKELIATAGWNTLIGVISLKKDEDLDIPMIRKLLKRIEKEIHSAPNMVKYTMNQFVIGAGSFVKELYEEALRVAKNNGDIYVDMGNTSCKVPFAADYIRKVKDKGKLGKKKKTVKC